MLWWPLVSFDHNPLRFFSSNDCRGVKNESELTQFVTVTCHSTDTIYEIYLRRYFVRSPLKVRDHKDLHKIYRIRNTWVYLPSLPQFYPGKHHFTLILPLIKPVFTDPQITDEKWRKLHFRNLTKTIMIFRKNDLCIFTLKRITIVVIEYKLYNRHPSCNYN